MRNRELIILPVANTTMSKIVYSGGGKVPENLSGFYTSQHYAKQAIDTYIEGVRNKVTVRGKSKNK